MNSSVNPVASAWQLELETEAMKQSTVYIPEARHSKDIFNAVESVECSDCTKNERRSCRTKPKSFKNFCRNIDEVLLRSKFSSMEAKN